MNGGTITFKFTGDKRFRQQSWLRQKETESKFKNLASTIGKGVAVGIGAATTALAGFSKASVSAFADYEQLTGGIETLFAGKWKKN